METTEKTTTATFNEIYVNFYERILNFLTPKLNGKREIAEELTQDTFLKVYEHIESYNNEKGAISTWVYTIAQRILIDYYRKDKSSQMVTVDGFVSESGEATFEFADTSNADETVNREERMSKIDRAMEILNDNEKKIANLYFIEGRQYKEICNILDLPLNTVKVNILRIRKKLQSKLSKQYHS